MENLIDLAQRHLGKQTVSRLSVVGLSYPTEPQPLVFDPSACLVLQGAKRLIVGGSEFRYGPGASLVVGAEIAALGQVVEASPERPYLALVLTVDPAMDPLVPVEDDPAPLPAFGIADAPPETVDAWARLAALLDRPAEIAALARPREQELLFRLSTGPMGELLTHVATRGSRLARIRRVMAFLSEHYAEGVSVEAMAKVAGMSLTVFHRHFRRVTGLTPLAYQKHLRLHEARRRLDSAEGTASQIAIAVGYESASQFSREYRRLIGTTPLGRIRRSHLQSDRLVSR